MEFNHVQLVFKTQRSTILLEDRLPWDVFSRTRSMYIWVTWVKASSHSQAALDEHWKVSLLPALKNQRQQHRRSAPMLIPSYSILYNRRITKFQDTDIETCSSQLTGWNCIVATKTTKKTKTRTRVEVEAVAAAAWPPFHRGNTQKSRLHEISWDFCVEKCVALWGILELPFLSSCAGIYSGSGSGPAALEL